MPDASRSLTIAVAGQRFRLPVPQVVRVGYVGAVSALPFARPPVEGLTVLDGTPVTQIDTARALGLPRTRGDKLVVLRFDRGRLALRVDETVGVGPTGPDLPDLPDLPMEPILRHFSAFSAEGSESDPGPARSAAPAADETIDLLLVLVDGETIALFATGVDRVVEVEAVQRLDVDGGAPVDVAIVDGHPLATIPLGRRPVHHPCDPGSGGWGVVSRSDGPAAVLLVDRVLRVIRVPMWRLGRVQTSGTQPTLCVSTPDGPVFPLHDLAALTGGTPVPVPAAVSQTHQQTTRTAKRADGLLVRCAGTALVVPLAMIGRVCGHGDLTPAGFGTPDANECFLRVFDGGRLMAVRPPGITTATPNGAAVVVTIGGRTCAILVDRTALDTGTPPWLPAPWLPDVTAALFDAVRHDPVTDGWVLRLRSQPAALTWTVRRAMVSARCDLALREPTPPPPPVPTPDPRPAHSRGSTP